MAEAAGIRVSKRRRAATVKEVLSRISREVGPDAIIIAHGRTPGPKGGVWAEAVPFNPERAGRRRFRTRVLVPAAGVLFLAAAVFTAWKLLTTAEAGPSIPAKLTAAVISFEDSTGDGAHGSLSEAIPSLLITRLEESGFFDVIPWERMRNLFEQERPAGPASAERDAVLDLCRKTNIDVLITGSFARTGDVYVTSVKVLDVKSEKIRIGVASKGEGKESILRTQIDELGRLILQGFGFFGAGTNDPPVRIAEITTDSMDAYYHYLRGRECYSNENLKDARIFFEKAVLLDPRFAMAHFYLASTLSISGARQASLKELEKATTLAGRTTEKERLFIQGMSILMRPGDYDEGVRVFQEMKRLYPRDKDGPYGLGLVYVNQRRYEAGIRELRKALELDPYDGKTLGLIATAYSNVRDYSNALEYYRRQIEASPGNGLARAHMAICYRDMGKLGDAVEKCNEAFEADPEVRPLAVIAQIYALNEEYEKALRLIEKVVQVEKYRYFEKSILDFWAGKLRQAETDLRRYGEYAAAAKSRQSEANALWVSGWIAFERGNDERAADLFRGWLDIYAKEILPKRENAAAVAKHWRSWLAFYLGLIDLKLGKTESAQARLAEIESLLPDIVPDYRDWIASCRNRLEAEIFLAEGDARSAVRAAERSPSSPACSVLGTEWLRSLPFLGDILARAYRRNGDIDMAIAEYERVISSNRTGRNLNLIHPKSYFRLGELYEAKKLDGEAARCYGRFLDLWKNADADIPEIAEARKRLARLKDGS